MLLGLGNGYFFAYSGASAIGPMGYFTSGADDSGEQDGHSTTCDVDRSPNWAECTPRDGVESRRSRWKISWGQTHHSGPPSNRHNRGEFHARRHFRIQAEARWHWPQNEWLGAGHSLLPTSTQSLIHLNQCDQFIALSLGKAKFGSEGIRFVGEYLQVVGRSRLEPHLGQASRIPR